MKPFYLASVYNEFGQLMGDKEYDTLAQARKATKLALRVEIWRFGSDGQGAKVYTRTKRA